MLMNLLYEISKGGAYSDIKAAEKLGTSEEMIIQVKNQLEYMGYIQEDKPSCDSECSGGCVGYSCSSNSKIKMCSITEKVKKQLRNLQNKDLIDKNTNMKKIYICMLIYFLILY